MMKKLFISIALCLPLLGATNPIVAQTPLQVSVSASPDQRIELFDGDCVYITWTVNISGGTPGYSSSLYLNGSFVGNGTSYSDWYCGYWYATAETLTFRADVVDAANQSKQVSYPTYMISTITPWCAPCRV